MSFPLNLYLGSLISGCLATALSMPFWRRWCAARGLVDEPGARKIHAEPIVLAGGLAVLTGLLLPILVGTFGLLALRGGVPGWNPELLIYGLGRRKIQLGIILAGACGMVFLGWLDDKYELTPSRKFAGQLAIAGLVAAAGVRITLFVPSITFSYLITILWILTLTNALNFMDNMNGLCPGIGIIGTACFAASAAVQGQYLVALIALQTCGALLGFLPFNFPRASSFLGDSGSHLVGYLLAVLAILPHYYSQNHTVRWAVASPLLILAVPLLDLIWVVVLRWQAGRPFYVGDTNHLSHRLVRLGLSKTTAVLLIWFAAASTGSMAILLLTS